MARGTTTLYDLSPAQRAKGAAEVRKATLQMLSNPHLTPEQREELRARLAWASKFESCDIADVLERPETREPVNHVIEISESLSVEET
jgi:hypothetical protein